MPVKSSRLLRLCRVLPLCSALLWVSACDQQRIEKLEEGVSTEADVRRQFGEPTQITEKADGSKVLEYPRQPEGASNYVIVIGADGKMSSLRQLLTPNNFAQVQAGMSQDEVRRMLGKPAKTLKYAMKPDEDVWEWRFREGQKRMVFEATFDRDARVLKTATHEDVRDTHTGG